MAFLVLQVTLVGGWSTGTHLYVSLPCFLSVPLLEVTFSYPSAGGGAGMSCSYAFSQAEGPLE